MSDSEHIDHSSVVSYASEAYEAIRAINHQTRGVAIPATEVYTILGNAHALGYALQQALRQIGAGLVQSLDEYNVREDDGSDPAIHAMAAQDLMNQAADHAAQIGLLLQDAQGKISGSSCYDEAEQD